MRISISSSSFSKRPQFIRKDSAPHHQTIHSIESVDSISSISMHDLPPDDSAGSSDEFDVLATTKYPTPPRIEHPPAIKRAQQLSPNAYQTLQPQSSSLLQTPRSPNTPITPQISETPPTPQSSEYETAPLTPVTTVIQRPRGRFSFTAAQPLGDEPTSPVEPLPSPHSPPISSSLPLSPISPEPAEAQVVEFPLTTSPVTSPTAEDPESDPLRLHRELRSRRSRSASHKRRLIETGSGSSSPALTSGQSTPATFEPVPPTPPMPASRDRSTSLSGPSNTVSRPRGRQISTAVPPSSFRSPVDESSSALDDGRVSPDIGDLLEKTPRPRRRSSASRSRLSSRTSLGSLGTSTKRSRSASRSRKSAGSSIDGKRRASEGVPSMSASKKGYRESFIKREQERDARLEKLERELEGIGSDESDDGGAGAGPGFGYDVRSASGSEGEEGLLPDEDGSASDSSLDIHTPLP
ncbi:hypothetical protein VNI00_011213 [Paramarasmius palmivorus]|uniref:Uncharacterized protein n=1 Tax=Paramarasmius palmivorus TaxID=297713 RepID=A0AAW0CGY7_9AGAR